MTSPHLSPFASADSLVFISGQLAFEPGGKFLSGEVTEQTAQVLRNPGGGRHEGGLRMTDVVKTTVWMAAVRQTMGMECAHQLSTGIYAFITSYGHARFRSSMSRAAVVFGLQGHFRHPGLRAWPRRN
jgi:enamine deaminase RidA (YjgF/YER057c/UK114 family)